MQRGRKSQTRLLITGKLVTLLFLAKFVEYGVLGSPVLSDAKSSVDS